MLARSVFHPKPRSEAFSILDPAVIEQPIYPAQRHRASARAPALDGAPACFGGEAPVSIPSHFEYLLKAACSDAQSPSLYLARARQWPPLNIDSVVPLNGNSSSPPMSLSSSFYPQRPQAQFDRCNRFKRALWSLVWLCLFRPSPRIAFAWRRGLLRLFGARLAATAQVYPSTRVWAPWNLAMHAHAVLGESVDCQSVGLIEIGADVAVSQYVHLCAASHAIDSPDHATTIGTIRLEPGCWVFAGAFIGPNVTVGRGAVVGARSVVVKSVPALQVVAGNPAKFIRQRAAEWALPSH